MRIPPSKRQNASRTAPTEKKIKIQISEILRFSTFIAKVDERQAV